jgi:hypothetical protein
MGVRLSVFSVLGWCFSLYSLTWIFHSEYTFSRKLSPILWRMFTVLYVCIYKVVQIWPGQTVTCLHTNSPGHIWTTLYIYIYIYSVCVCVYVKGMNLQKNRKNEVIKNGLVLRRKSKISPLAVFYDWYVLWFILFVPVSHVSRAKQILTLFPPPPHSSIKFSVHKRNNLDSYLTYRAENSR